jgi:hypothetical protein
MKRKYFLFLCLSFYIVNCTFYIEAQATIRYVSKTGTSTPPYTSWQTAADSIQKCINICSFGDTVYVANGVYKEQVVMIPGLSLIGAGMDSCIIDMIALAPIQPSAIEMRDSCLVKGFKLIFDSSDPHAGTGIYMRDSSKGCTVTENSILYADNGVWVTEGKINKNIIIKSVSAIVGAVIDYSRQYIAYIDSNFISFYSQGIFPLDNTIINANNNIFKIESENPSSEILYNNLLSNTSTPDFSNNDIAKDAYNVIHHKAIQNTYPGDFANNQFQAKFETVFSNSSSSASFKNNNVINSQSTYNGVGDVRYNNFWNVGNYPQDTTNISVDPMFVNDTSDYHLQEFSPLIDAGDPSIIDKDGSRSDIGLYGGPNGEKYKYQDLPPKIPVNFSAIVDSPEVKLIWNKNTESDFRFYRLYRDTVAGFIISPTNLAAELQDTFYIQQMPLWNKNYYYKITAVDNQANESEPSIEIFINITSIDEYPTTISDYALYQNYPNPFNPSTKIGYRLKKRGYVKMYIYDLTGSSISVLVNEEKADGYYEVEFNAANELASGIYLYRISITDSEKRIPVFNGMGKMILMK